MNWGVMSHGQDKYFLLFFKMNSKLKHRFTLQHLLHIKIAVLFSNSVQILYAECCHQAIIHHSNSESLQSMKYSEKWSENGKQKSLTRRIQEICWDNFILEKITLRLILEHLLMPQLKGLILKPIVMPLTFWLQQDKPKSNGNKIKTNT